VNLVVHGGKWRESGSSWGVKLISPPFFFLFFFKKKFNKKNQKINYMIGGAI
jgi:hypothetical protein